MGRYPDPYVPGLARAGEVTPQTHPGLFTEAEVKAEIRYLLDLSTRIGASIPRTDAAANLSRHLDNRAQVLSYVCPCCGDAVLDTGPVCSDCQAESCEVTLDSAGDRDWWRCQRTDTDSE